MYKTWNRGVGVNGDKGGYITLKLEDHPETVQLAREMPHDVVYQSLYALTGEGYQFALRVNPYYNEFEASAYLRRDRWQDNQTLQIVHSDPFLALTGLLVRVYEDFYDHPDWMVRAVEIKAGNRVSELNRTHPTPLSDDEIAF